MSTFDMDNPNSKYRPEYAAQVYDHILNGYSLSSFKVKPAARQKTIFYWYAQIEEFALAVDGARADFLMRIETGLVHKAFGTPLTEKQKEWMPKVDGKILRFLAMKRYRREYGNELELIKDEPQKITRIIFEEVGRREPTKRDPVTGAPLKPDVIIDATEV